MIKGIVKDEVTKQMRTLNASSNPVKKTTAAQNYRSTKSKYFDLPISSFKELEDFHDKLLEQSDFRTDFVSFTIYEAVSVKSLLFACLNQ